METNGQKLTISASLANLEIRTAHQARHAFLSNGLILVPTRKNRFPALGLPSDLPGGIYIKLEFGHEHHWITLLKAYCAYSRCGIMIDGISGPYCSPECRKSDMARAMPKAAPAVEAKTSRSSLIEMIRSLPKDKQVEVLKKLGIMK